MAKGLINRYVWLIDTIQRYGRITREDLNNLWVKSSLSDGEPIPRRTFYNYRQGVEETFNVIISCDPATFEYYIEDSGDEQDENLRNWLLDSASISGMLSDSKDVAGRILLEDVPSAREHLPVIMQALKGPNRL
ncbi:MAG: WYL domain-containing protein, partial [Muribaculaceae bacterium]